MTLYFLFLETLGTTEILVIVVVALVLFGPRKLPQLSRSLGKSLSEFKKASEDFKRTWEREVAVEETDFRDNSDRAALPPQDNSILKDSVERGAAISAAVEADQTESRAEPDEATASETIPPTITKIQPSEPSRKQDWL